MTLLPLFERINMKVFVLTFLFSISALANEPIKVAILDTGFDFNSKWEDAEDVGLKKPILCKKGHKDFTNTGLQDNHGHGTHVAGIVARFAKKDYCLIILKTHDVDADVKTNQSAIYMAVQYATKIGADIINYSGGGYNFLIKEYIEVKKALDKGIMIVAAAGNARSEDNYQVHHVRTFYKSRNNKELDFKYEVSYINRKTLEITKDTKRAYFPAAYDPRIISVTSYSGKKRHNYSNYGAAYLYQDDGDKVFSLLPHNMYGTLSGTSMAAPRKTAQIINNWDM